MLAPIAVSSVYLLSQGLREAAIGVAIGGIAGWLITPDADVDGISYEEQRWFKINPILGYIWHLFWYAYGKIFKHRGLSHVAFIGTLTRIFYIVIPITILQLVWALKFHPDFIGADLFFVHLYNSFPYLCRGIYLSWSAQDIVHIIFDICSTWLKRRRLLWYANL